MMHELESYLRLLQSVHEEFHFISLEDKKRRFTKAYTIKMMDVLIERLEDETTGWVESREGYPT